LSSARPLLPMSLASTHKNAVFNPANKGPNHDVVMAPPFVLLIIRSPSLSLPLSSTHHLLPMLLVPTPPARTTPQSHHAGTACVTD
jgi:hypothetical protein